MPSGLAGAANDPRNPWPEKGNDTGSYYLNPTDVTESKLIGLVVERKLTLRRAQRLIVVDWVTAGRKASAR